ncbi:hypothetical protein [Foetidibacter luteolus]|uniref:hypothetical protein n=1 Tax=Foetidibacter luteolus TaxID=2608880 RepID=UPI00129AF46B|nr:hypothetical protein [Foetidibacter luteolus]
MIHLQLNTQDRTQLRYTLHRLEYLKDVISNARTAMGATAGRLGDSYLKVSVLSFVAETAPQEEEVEQQIASLSHFFPLQDLHPANSYQGIKESFDCVFECAAFYENETRRVFRRFINDNMIIPEVRKTVQYILNEMLYAFLKIRMLNCFTVKEMSGEAMLF